MARQTVKQTLIQIGGLSTPSKMPGYGYGLSAFKCKQGSKLRCVPGSTCSKCYARSGNYCFPCVRQAHKNRLQSISTVGWVDNMVWVINYRANRKRNPIHVFRWHDSGDIQSLEHLERIVLVCQMTPSVKHWLPSKEYAIVGEYLRKHGSFPSNLCVRISAPMIGQQLHMWKGLPTSSVNNPIGFQCPVANGKQGCDTHNCRACWDNSVPNVNYKKH
jgi:hypothetical protein